MPEEGLEEHLERLVQRCVQVPEQLDNRGTRRMDRVLLHPLVGLVAFLAIVLAMFQLIYSVGTPMQELLGQGFDWIQNRLLTPGLELIGFPDLIRDFLVEGVWLGVTTVSSFLPIIFLFYLVMAVVEDSGYLPRAAFLMDGFMHWLGLDGRSFVLQVMGFGCNVPSIMGTRVIRDPAQRLLTMMVIPFALCQARLTVFLFMAGVFFPRPWWAPGLVVFGFYLLSFGAAIVTGLIFRNVWGGREAFVLELPPYRQPSLRTILGRAWIEMGNFLVTTRVFIVLGASAIWLLTNLPPGSAQAGGSLADAIGQLFAPIFAPDRHGSGPHSGPVLRLHRQGNPAGGHGGDLPDQRSRPRDRAPDRHQPSPGPQLHGLHPPLHPLPGHGGRPDEGIPQPGLRPSLGALVPCPGLGRRPAGLSGGPLAADA